MKKLLLISMLLICSVAWADGTTMYQDLYLDKTKNAACLKTDANGKIESTTCGGSVNWSELPSVMSAQINWTDINKLAPMQRGGMNWSDLNRSELQTKAVNWSSLSNAIQSTGINWTNITQFQAAEIWSPEVTDTPSGTDVTVNWVLGKDHYFQITNTGTTTVTMTNPKSRSHYCLVVKQKASAGVGNIAFSPSPLVPRGVTLALTATNNAVDVFCFTYSGALSKYLCEESKDFI
jgi:hypothetical protein